MALKKATSHTHPNEDYSGLRTPYAAEAAFFTRSLSSSTSSDCTHKSDKNEHGNCGQETLKQTEFQELTLVKTNARKHNGAVGVR